MILIACILAIASAFVLALIIKGVTSSISSSGTETFGYYFSGLVFTLALAITPVLTLGQRNYGQPIVFGMRSEDVFWSSIFPVAAIFLSYLFFSKRLRVQRWNILALFLLCTAATIGARYAIQRYGNVYLNGLDGVVYWTVVLALLVIQAFLARVHHRYAK